MAFPYHRLQGGQPLDAINQQRRNRTDGEGSLSREALSRAAERRFTTNYPTESAMRTNPMTSSLAAGKSQVCMDVTLSKSARPNSVLDNARFQADTIGTLSSAERLHLLSQLNESNRNAMEVAERMQEQRNRQALLARLVYEQSSFAVAPMIPSTAAMLQRGSFMSQQVPTLYLTVAGRNDSLTPAVAQYIHQNQLRNSLPMYTPRNLPLSSTLFQQQLQLQQFNSIVGGRTGGSLPSSMRASMLLPSGQANSDMIGPSPTKKARLNPPRDYEDSRGEATFHFSKAVVLYRPVDGSMLSKLQALLRQQIEAFEATENDISTHVRGRNKSVQLGQVGIRCRHCKCLPVLERKKGSAFFPTSVWGIYQASQNMCNSHLMHGECVAMPVSVRNEFAVVSQEKGVTSGAGRKYWAESVQAMGLVDTEDGIYFATNLPPGVRFPQIDKESNPGVYRTTKPRKK